MSYEATEQYTKLQKMPMSKMFYRGDGWPGKNCLVSSVGKTIEYAHLGSLYERMFSSQIFKNPGCRYCSDHFAEKAEISFCDFWNKDELEHEHEGNSCVIIRSDRAKKIYEGMIKDGFIKTVTNLDKNEVIGTQISVLRAKKSNLHNSLEFRIFTSIIDYIYKHQIYKYFGIREYIIFCRIYGKLCANQVI